MFLRKPVWNIEIFVIIPISELVRKHLHQIKYKFNISISEVYVNNYHYDKLNEGKIRFGEWRNCMIVVKKSKLVSH